jgi:hypothetical protein
MRATFQAELEKVKKAIKNAKGAMSAAASQMFVFYANLLSVEGKYVWNKIIEEQMEGNPYVHARHLSSKPKGNVLQVV